MSMTGLTMIICAYGFSAGGVQGLYNAAVYEICKPIDESQRKKRGEARQGGDDPKVKVRLALVLLIVGVATLTGAPVGGALIGRRDGDYLGAQLFAASSVLLGGVLLIAARVARIGWGVGRT